MALITVGVDRGRGMLLGVEPRLQAASYRSVETFTAAVGAPLDEARAAGVLGPKTVAVYGEHVGTWLVATGEGDGTIRAGSVAAASRRIALRRPLRFAVAFAAARGADRAAAALFRLKAPAMAAAYQETFGGIARRFGVTVVAGSLALPRPVVRAGRLRPGSGPLENACAVFAPDGGLHERLARKCFPTAAEQPWLSAAGVEDLPAFETPAGRLGVLVCADSWYPACWQRLRALAVDIVAVPSHVTSEELWRGPWRGYSGNPAPADVDPADTGSITEAEAWRKYALAGRIATCGARVGLTVLLRGRFWDIGTGGRTTVVRDGAVTVVEPGPGGPWPSLVGCWL